MEDDGSFFIKSSDYLCNQWQRFSNFERSHAHLPKATPIPFQPALIPPLGVTMLRGISPLISPELLASLARMGHGDEIVLADAHFPGESFNPRVLRADGLRIPDLLAANFATDVP